MSSSKKEKFARVGIATKGLIYVILGGLTAFAAFSSQESITASNGALKYIAGQSFGQILLIITTIGIIAYVMWRLYLAFQNPENRSDSDTKSAVKRLGYFFSAISYALLAYTAIEILLNNSTGGSGKQSWISTILDQSWGVYLIYFIALVLLGKALYELYRAYSGKFKSKIQNAELDRKAQSFLIKAGKVGFTARSIVFAIIAYTFFRAASATNAQMAGGTKMAFAFLQEQGGQILLAVIAFGLALYGVYLLASSRYRNIPIR
ncbi:DUF1206 domain-containing protein [Nonlabens marinus]|uniref:DUF1206 domain-containing protein n=1 Tax=Nonlabens marinus S1-08 TaxID=1454201 RepID=W8VSZ6_9FLAO|nr:DUF1206 domain-containing protein [Nonlabens marinus]BAO56645.1 hypothetical protein NMS_2636 [Nonlabens marinus S1-08]